MSNLNLAEIEARAKAAAALAEKATAGPWYAHATDDEYFMNARYVGTVPGPQSRTRTVELADGTTREFTTTGDFIHDGGNGMALGFPDQADSESVVAITLLQQPRLADPDGCDENTLFIAAARSDVPALAADVAALVAEVARLRAAQEDARELLVACWHQLAGPVFLLSDGTVHPGAVSTLHELDAYLWPDLQPGQERE